MLNKMRFLSLNCSMLLVTMCIIMQQQSVAAKPFIFKFFVPQAPARADSSTTSSSSSLFGIDFGSILSTKLNLLTSLLRTGLSNGVSGGFNFGFKKQLPTTQVSSTRRPYTSTTMETPVDEFEPDSTTKSSLKTTSSTTTSETTPESDKNDNTSGSDNLSEPIDGNDNGNTEVTTDKNTNIDNGPKLITEKIVAEQTKNINGEVTKVENGYEYTTSAATTVRNQSNGYSYTPSKQNGYGYSSPQTGYNYGYSNQAMNENEISNEIMAISNQYLPAF